LRVERMYSRWQGLRVEFETRPRLRAADMVSISTARDIGMRGRRTDEYECRRRGGDSCAQRRGDEFLPEVEWCFHDELLPSERPRVGRPHV